MDNVIELPLSSNEIIDIHCNELPNTPASELSAILIEEKVPLNFHVRLALEYAQRDLDNQAILLLEASLQRCEFNQESEKVPLLLLLAQLSSSSSIAKATTLLNQAHAISPLDPTLALIKSSILLQADKPEEAQKQLKGLLEVNSGALTPLQTSALFLRAKCWFMLGDWLRAEKCFIRLLRALPPGTRPDPRIGLGLCLDRQGKYEYAVLWLRRAHQLDPQNGELCALLALALMNHYKDANKKGEASGAEDVINEVRRLLIMAFQLDKLSPAVLLGLSDQYFYQGKTDKALSLAEKQLEVATFDQERAEAHYYFARCHHLMESYSEAYAHYRRATAYTPNHLAALFGLGQMHIQRGEYASAITAFERVYKAEDDLDSLIILAALYLYHPPLDSNGLSLANSSYHKIMERLAQSAALSGQADESDLLLYAENTAAGDPDMFMELAQSRILSENVSGSLKAAKTAKTLYLKKQRDPPYELNHLIASLSHFEGNLSVAREEYLRLVKDDSVAVTTLYNLGRLYQQEGQLNLAKSTFERILKEHPSYSDARIQLALLADAVKEHVAGSRLLSQEALRPKPTLNALITIAARSFKRHAREPKSARRLYERAAKDREDPWAWLGVGSMCLWEARLEKESSIRKKFYHKAADAFSLSIKADDHCIAAANGLAVAIAETGGVTLAKDFFQQLKDASPYYPQCWFNLGLAQMQLGLNNEAILTLEHFIKKFPDQAMDPQISLTLAKCLFNYAKEVKNTVLMQRATKFTKKCIMLRPSDLIGYYDLGMSEQAYTQLYIDQSPEQRTISGLEECKRKLDSCVKLFTQLEKLSRPDEELPFSRNIAEQRARYAESVVRIITLTTLPEQARFEEDLMRRERRNQEIREMYQREALEQEQVVLRKRALEQAEETAHLEQLKAVVDQLRQTSFVVEDGEGEGDEDGSRKKRKLKKSMKMTIAEEDEETPLYSPSF